MKNRVTPSLAAPGDTNLSDATAGHGMILSWDLTHRAVKHCSLQTSLHIKASQKRSSSSLSSDSVGSIIKQPETGNDIVGA